MKELQAFLSGIQNKTALVSKLLAFLILANLVAPAFVSASVLGWADLIGVIAVVWFKYFASSGTLPKGWSFWFYVINGCLFATEAINLFSAAQPIEPGLMIKITAAINGIYGLAQFLNGAQSPTTPSV